MKEIIITQTDKGFNIKFHAENLCYGDMIDTIASLTNPNYDNQKYCVPCLDNNEEEKQIMADKFKELLKNK